MLLQDAGEFGELFGCCCASLICSNKTMLMRFVSSSCFVLTPGSSPEDRWLSLSAEPVWYCVWTLSSPWFQARCCGELGSGCSPVCLYLTFGLLSCVESCTSFESCCLTVSDSSCLESFMLCSSMVIGFFIFFRLCLSLPIPRICVIVSFLSADSPLNIDIYRGSCVGLRLGFGA